MIFLIEYDRQRGEVVEIKEFEKSDRIKAEKERLKLELALNRKKVVHEVVLLEADNESRLRHTHRRYFASLNAILESTGS